MMYEWSPTSRPLLVHRYKITKQGQETTQKSNTYRQFLKMITDRLLNKPYVNGVSLTEQNLSLECCQSLEPGMTQTMDMTAMAKICNFYSFKNFGKWY